jgi:hypothetical protein
VRNSVITQKWVATRGIYKLIDESIRSGDPRIFAEAEASQDEGATQP